MLHCDLRVRWKVASDLRFRAAISGPKTPSFCRIYGDLAPSTWESLGIAIVRFWCAKVKRGVFTFVSTSDFQSEVGEVFGEIGGELPAKLGRRFSSFVCWGNRQKHFPTPPQISPSNFTARFWVVAGPTFYQPASTLSLRAVGPATVLSHKCDILSLLKDDQIVRDSRLPVHCQNLTSRRHRTAIPVATQMSSPPVCLPPV